MPGDNVVVEPDRELLEKSEPGPFL